MADCCLITTNGGPKFKSSVVDSTVIFASPYTRKRRQTTSKCSSTCCHKRNAPTGTALLLVGILVLSLALMYIFTTNNTEIQIYDHFRLREKFFLSSILYGGVSITSNVPISDFSSVKQGSFQKFVRQRDCLRSYEPISDGASQIQLGNWWLDYESNFTIFVFKHDHLMYVDVTFLKNNVDESTKRCSTVLKSYYWASFCEIDESAHYNFSLNIGAVESFNTSFLVLIKITNDVQKQWTNDSAYQNASLFCNKTTSCFIPLSMFSSTNVTLEAQSRDENSCKTEQMKVTWNYNIRMPVVMASISLFSVVVLVTTMDCLFRKRWSKASSLDTKSARHKEFEINSASECAEGGCGSNVYQTQNSRNFQYSDNSVSTVCSTNYEAENEDSD